MAVASGTSTDETRQGNSSARVSLPVATCTSVSTNHPRAGTASTQNHRVP